MKIRKYNMPHFGKSDSKPELLNTNAFPVYKFRLKTDNFEGDIVGKLQWLVSQENNVKILHELDI